MFICVRLKVCDLPHVAVRLSENGFLTRRARRLTRFALGRADLSAVARACARRRKLNITPRQTETRRRREERLMERTADGMTNSKETREGAGGSGTIGTKGEEINRWKGRVVHGQSVKGKRETVL